MTASTARALPTGKSFVWKVPPSVLAANLARYVARITVLIERMMDLFAVRMQEYARSTAPWTDRTGDARRNLSTKVIKVATMISIILHSGATHYTIYLEFGHMNARGGGFTHAYPVIFPTLEIFYGQIMAALQRLMKGR